MAVRKILLYDDPILRKPSELINSGEINTPQVKELMLDLLDTMYSMPAYGVAAIQIGTPKQMFVLDTAWDYITGENQKPQVFMNPEILSMAFEVPFEEGCLSLPGGVVNTLRNNRLLLQYMTIEGQVITEEFTGLTAIAIQHECEHLSGALFIDKFGPLKKELVLRKTKKHLKNLKRNR